MHNVRVLVKAGPDWTRLDRTGSAPEVVTWSRLHTYAEIPYWMVVLIIFLLFAVPECMMAAIVISDSDSEFE